MEGLSQTPLLELRVQGFSGLVGLPLTPPLTLEMLCSPPLTLAPLVGRAVEEAAHSCNSRVHSLVHDSLGATFSKTLARKGMLALATGATKLEEPQSIGLDF